MSNDDHLRILRDGVEAWNEWRDANRGVRPELSSANLAEVDLRGVNLSRANLYRADLREAGLYMADLRRANLSRADVSGADLSRADMRGANLSRANLREADLTRANLSAAKLTRANLRGADLPEADLRGADLPGADLRGVDLSRADLSRAGLSRANLSEADLSRADLTRAQFVGTKIGGACLSGAHVYGAATWDLIGEPAEQNNLVITPRREPAITVDDLEVAQFMYLMIHNEKLRRVIDTITSKVVLILGRFSKERKVVLDAVRTELRERYNYSPVVFDFDKSAGKSLTDTVRLLAGMARFVIVDLSEATSANYELGVLSQLGLRRTPFVIMAETGLPTMAMLDDVLAMQEVLDVVHRYDDLPHLKATLVEAVLEPAEARWRELNPATGSAESL